MKASKKKHVVAVVRDIDGTVGLTFCGRVADADCDSPAAMVWKIERGLFRAELHCARCLLAPELNELVYLRSEIPAATENLIEDCG